MLLLDWNNNNRSHRGSLSSLSTALWNSFIVASFVVLVTNTGTNNHFATAVTTALPIKSWTLYHTIGGQDEKRGTITMKLVDNNSIVKLEIEPVKDILNEETANTILSTTLYQLKLIEDNDTTTNNNNNNNKKQNVIITSVPSCLLRRANYRDEIIFLMDVENGGTVLSMEYVPLVSPLAPKDCTEYKSLVPETMSTATYNNTFITTKVTYDLSTTGMSLGNILPGSYKPPPGLKRIPNAYRAPTPGGMNSNNNKMGKQPGGGGGVFGDDTVDPLNPTTPDSSIFGFFRRYWYIIVPIMLIQMMSGVQDQNEVNRQQQPPPPGQQQQGQAQAAVRSSPSAGAQRRGKRD